MGDAFKINDAGPKSGKNAAHVAAERSNFLALYWLIERGADFECKDNAGKTAAEYLQQSELAAIGTDPMSKGDRKYYLCNAHEKIWLAHDPAHFMPYLYQEDFRQYRARNPDGDISAIYSRSLLSDAAFAELTEFATAHKVALVCFETDFARLTDQYGTNEDKCVHRFASSELAQYPNEGGGNLAVVADLIRQSTVLLRMGNYVDTDVEVGQHRWTGSIRTEKAFAYNLGSLIYSQGMTPWINIDILAPASLFPRPLKGNFKITLSKTACYLIKKTQTTLLDQYLKNNKLRIEQQKNINRIFTDLSAFLKNFFNASGAELANTFTSSEINRVRARGLELLTQDEKGSVLKRVVNLLRAKVIKEYGSLDMAQQYSELFLTIKSDEHEKFLLLYMQKVQTSNLKLCVKALTGTDHLAPLIGRAILSDEWDKYSIYASEELASAFRTKNTVRFNTPIKELERIILTQSCADLSFTPGGMADVMKRSEALKMSQI